MMRKNPFLPHAQQRDKKRRLTPDERQKIDLEEKARSEARDRLAAEKKTEERRLTPEERRKIYLEEKARTEAKDKLAADQEQATAQRENKELPRSEKGKENQVKEDRVEILERAKFDAKIPSTVGWLVLGVFFSIIAIVVVYARSPTLNAVAIAKYEDNLKLLRVYETQYVSSLKQRQVKATWLGCAIQVGIGFIDGFLSAI